MGANVRARHAREASQKAVRLSGAVPISVTECRTIRRHAGWLELKEVAKIK
jgi:hypothetical protein